MKYYLIVLFGFILLQSCKSQSPIKKLSEDSIIKTSLTALDYIKIRDYEGFKSLIPTDLKKAFPEDKLRTVIDAVSDIIKKEGVPNGNDVQSRISFNLNGKDTIAVNTIAFLYKNEQHSDNPYSKEITFSFIERYGNKKIVGFNINTDPQNAKTAELKISPINKLEFSADNVSNYRIYYNEGIPAKTMFGKNKGIFALEGNNTTFNSSGLAETFKPIFIELKKCNLVNPQKFTTMLNYDDNSEFIQTELLFDKSDYGIFIYIPLKGNKTVTDKIIIRQFQFANLGYEYHLDKNEYNKLTTLIENIKSKSWGSNYVDNP